MVCNVKDTKNDHNWQWRTSLQSKEKQDSNGVNKVFNANSFVNLTVIIKILPEICFLISSFLLFEGAPPFFQGLLCSLFLPPLFLYSQWIWARNVHMMGLSVVGKVVECKFGKNGFWLLVDDNMVDVQNGLFLTKICMYEFDIFWQSCDISKIFKLGKILVSF